MTERPGGPIDTCELGLTLISLAKEFEVKVNNQIGHATRTQIWVTTALKSTLQRLCEIEDAELPTNLLNTLKAPGVITNHNTITWPAEHHSKAMSALMKVLEILNGHHLLHRVGSRYSPARMGRHSTRLTYLLFHELTSG